MSLYHKDSLMRYSIRAGAIFFTSVYVLSVRSRLGNMMSRLPRVDPMVRRAFQRMVNCSVIYRGWMLGGRVNYGLLGFARGRVQRRVSVRLRSLPWLPRQGGCLFGGSILGISVNLDARLVLIYVICGVRKVVLEHSVRQCHDAFCLR